MATSQDIGLCMYFDDLGSFLHQLEQSGQLTRIQGSVRSQLELATIVDLICKGAGHGQGLLFEKVSGARLPVAANLFGTAERTGWALGTTSLEATAQRFACDLLQTGKTNSEQALYELCTRASWQPEMVADPVYRRVDHSREGLRLLPCIVAWPKDGGPYVTLAQVYTRHPDSKVLNCGLYRIQCHDSHMATIRFRPESGAAQHMAAWHARNQAMPVAIVLGGPPALTWAAAAPLPETIDETTFCSYLLQRRLEMCGCQSSDLHVPARAEIVIEGFMAPGLTAVEGPFGNHTGSYEGERSAPVLKVLTVHAREDAIYPWTLVGPPPMENIQLAQATARLFLPLVRMAVPSVCDLHMPDEGIFHRVALVTVDSGEDRPLPELARQLRETLLLRGSRLLVIGAADHDPHAPAAVFWRILNRVDWTRNVLVENGQVTIDARRIPAGGSVQGDPNVLAGVLGRWAEFGLG